ncbi:hypothetical protein B9Z19DRAFT_101972 [Tuber borchii]|uniref:Uncharacterized protein n=1 Tax=Tuber borchii TaxID=42251 RepID=A0A2T6ZRX8_TUBBO|nr:hypothetical protein B9Z19DRAFT_101972 [Tuber borchii]
MPSLRFFSLYHVLLHRHRHQPYPSMYPSTVTHPYHPPPSEIQPQPTHIPATPIQRKGRKGNYPLQQVADVSVIKKKGKTS